MKDPNGGIHHPKDSHCSGCDYLQNRNCQCGGLLHYWFIDSATDGDYLAYECEKCGNFQELKPELFENPEESDF